MAETIAEKSPSSFKKKNVMNDTENIATTPEMLVRTTDESEALRVPSLRN